MEPALDAQFREDIVKFSDPLIKGGFMGVDEIIEYVLGILLDVYDIDDRQLAEVKKLVRDAARERVAEQSTWPAVTDCDRLTSAFEKLEKAGIVCRENFSCCVNCGFVDLAWEIRSLVDKDRFPMPTGLVFYHQQDAETVTDNGNLNLAYSAFSEDGLGNDAVADAEVAKKVIAALHAAGLETKWDGDTQKRIQVSVDWKRRSASLSRSIEF